MRSYTLVSAVVLAIIAVAHLVRVFMSWPVQIADVSLPVWGSIGGFLLAAGLALWGFREAGRK